MTPACRPALHTLDCCNTTQFMKSLDFWQQTSRMIRRFWPEVDSPFHSRQFPLPFLWHPDTLQDTHICGKITLMLGTVMNTQCWSVSVVVLFCSLPIAGRSFALIPEFSVTGYKLSWNAQTQNPSRAWSKKNNMYFRGRQLNNPVDWKSMENVLVMLQKITEQNSCCKVQGGQQH